MNVKFRKNFLSAIACCLLIFLPCLAYAENQKDNELASALEVQNVFVKVSADVKPAVVSITTVQTIERPQYEFYFGDPFEDFFRQFFNEPQEQKPQRRKTYKYKTESGGSGVIIDPAGYVLTNEHVIRGADEINVTVNIEGKEKTYKGKVAGKDARTDIAVVKIISSGVKFPAAVLGDSDNISVGQWVLAIGSPFGLEQTVTDGIISAIRQSVQVEGKTYRNFIQTDASINRGNSGGPLCSIKGEVIGINTAIFAPTGVFAGVGFAIPINRAKDIMFDLIHKGKVIRGWLGIEIRPVDEAIRMQFSLPGQYGVLINRILPDSPAKKAGLLRGDVIIEINGNKIFTPGDLQDIVSKTGPRKEVTVKIIRERKDMDVRLVTGEMPEEIAEAGTTPKAPLGKPEEQGIAEWNGISVVNLEEGIQSKYNIPQNEKGVVVTEIDMSKKDAAFGLSAGDMIREINGTKIPDVKTFKDMVKKIDLKDGIVFDIVRDGEPLYISFSQAE